MSAVLSGGWAGNKTTRLLGGMPLPVVLLLGGCVTKKSEDKVTPTLGSVSLVSSFAPMRPDAPSGAPRADHFEGEIEFQVTPAKGESFFLRYAFMGSRIRTDVATEARGRTTVWELYDSVERKTYAIDDAKKTIRVATLTTVPIEPPRAPVIPGALDEVAGEPCEKWSRKVGAHRYEICSVVVDYRLPIGALSRLATENACLWIPEHPPDRGFPLRTTMFLENGARACHTEALRVVPRKQDPNRFTLPQEYATRTSNEPKGR